MLRAIVIVVLGVGTVVCCILLLPVASSLVHGLVKTVQPSVSFSLLPGQSTIIPRMPVGTFHIRSQFPVSIRGGDCSAPRAVDVNLSCETADMIITDFRPSVLIYGQANQVTIQKIEY